AFAQQFQELPPNSVVGNVLGQSNPSFAVPFNQLAAQLMLPGQGGLVQGPASAVAGHVVVFGAGPNVIADGGGVAGSGTVTSVTCGSGLSGGTITTTGTCAVNLSVITNALGANVSLNSIGTFFDGPSVAQGTSGTW